MTIKEFSIRLNALTKYTPRVVSIIEGKMEVFISGLRLDIAKDVMIEYYTSSTYLKALSKV